MIGPMAKCGKDAIAVPNAGRDRLARSDGHISILLLEFIEKIVVHFDLILPDTMLVYNDLRI